MNIRNSKLLQKKFDNGSVLRLKLIRIKTVIMYQVLNHNKSLFIGTVQQFDNIAFKRSTKSSLGATKRPSSSSFNADFGQPASLEPLMVSGNINSADDRKMTLVNCRQCMTLRIQYHNLTLLELKPMK